MAKFAVRLITVFSAGLIALTLAAWFFNAWLQKPGPLTTHETIILTPGLGVQAIADTLVSAGAIHQPTLFVVAVSIRRGDKFLKAGEYKLTPRATPEAIIDKLILGKTVVHKITVPEGLSVWQVYDLVTKTPTLSGRIDPRFSEGSLLPNTYHYSRGHDRNALLQKMETLMSNTLEQLWTERDPTLPLKTPIEAVILASIIEKETSLPQERRKISGVFINRLRLRMPLQSDPTVVYGVTQGKQPLGRPLKLQELRDKDNLYNTYRHLGLPPGPIANPGKDSLRAALSPLETTALYFVADGQGGHNFAETLAEHNKNVKLWRKHRKQELDCGAC